MAKWNMYSNPVYHSNQFPLVISSLPVYYVNITFAAKILFYFIFGELHWTAWLGGSWEWRSGFLAFLFVSILFAGGCSRCCRIIRLSLHFYDYPATVLRR